MVPKTFPRKAGCSQGLSVFDACAGVLDSLPTRAERDQDLLERASQGVELSECELLAIRWRHLYKKSLLNAVDIAQRVMDVCK